MLNDAEHWNSFYSDWKLSIPSQFCAMTAINIRSDERVVEFGCGNGRDAVCFARYGARVLAIDASQEAIQRASAENSAIPQDRLRFECCDVGNGSDITAAVQEWRNDDKRTFFYARFFLHSIDEDRQAALLGAIGGLMRPEDLLFLEFRTVHDADAAKEFGQHFRRYIDHDAFRSLLEDGGFVVNYSVQGYGMAVFGSEDAHVARFIARRA